MNREIPKATRLEERVFSLKNEKDFRSIALEVFHFQFHNNPVYQRFCRLLHRTPEEITRPEGIPFLPISFFKTHRVFCGTGEADLVFKSSGTTGLASSTHFVAERLIYERSFYTAFELFYGDVRDYCILGLLPSYLERGDSSLVYMVDHLIRNSGHELSGFYLDDHLRLAEVLQHLEACGQKTLLIGVTYALLDFGSKFPMPLKTSLVMETGGMKGRRRELTRAEVYEQLQGSFKTDAVHSEYGMTELLSQAYAVNGIFRAPPWMRVLRRDETDPLEVPGWGANEGSGPLNIIDLANLYSCSFIATDDLGRFRPEGFEVIGRIDNSDIRGCSLLAL